MEQFQYDYLRKASDQLNKIRKNLDLVMYDVNHTLTDAEFQRLREGYDKICEAIDKLS